MLQFVTYLEHPIFIRRLKSKRGAGMLKGPKSNSGVKRLQAICWKRKFGRNWLSICMQAPN